MGPWSEATDEVHVPPDVMPYAIGSDPVSPTADMKVQFQLVRFRPTDGVTVTRHFRTAWRGDRRAADCRDPLVGRDKAQASVIDFNSHQIVLDVNANKKTGGYQQLPTGFVGPPIERPVLALLLRPDGSVPCITRPTTSPMRFAATSTLTTSTSSSESGKERKAAWVQG